VNPLRPTPAFLRQLARQVNPGKSRRVQAWLAAMQAIPPPPRNLFHETTVVEVPRGGKVCGYEVWRHLAPYREDPRRPKARLYFGRRRSGSLARARSLAYQAAAMLSRMTRRELHEWWSEYKAARTTRRPVSNLWRDEPLHQDALDYTDHQQMSHLFRRRR
jgi:hypothetical protein